MMEFNFELKDHIGIFSNVYPEGFCEHIVDEFEFAISNGAGYNRIASERTPPHKKDDHQLLYDLRQSGFKNYKDNVQVGEGFYMGLQTCYEQYVKHYSVLLDDYKLFCPFMKLQKTVPGGGYHVWHAEDASYKVGGARVLTYMLYLNDVEEGGETEFLYQKLRFKPTKNTMLIWPAAYTHAHRGGLVLGNQNKYIVTGWFLNALQ